MVRVIPVHNFLEQNVAQTEEPTASCVASCAPEHSNKPAEEYLLLGMPTHCVEVRDLISPELSFVTAFPTVDSVTQILHCTKGNYVATLESKSGRDVASSNSAVRVYVNWISQERQPMRARIAGRVTPSLNRSQNSLEMIELPLNAKPTSIACCQATGNLLVAAGNTLILHEFKVETQNLSKMKFIDFEARPWSIGLPFSPTRLEIVEDYIAVMDSIRFVLFRLTNPLYDDIDHLSSLTSTTSSPNDKTTISTDFCSIETVDNSLSLKTNNDANLVKQKNMTNQNQKNNIDKNSNLRSFFNFTLKKNKQTNCVDWNNLVNNEKSELQSVINEGIIDDSSQSATVYLPSISLERAGPGHTLNPFVLNSIDTEVVIKTTSPDNGWSENYIVKSILRLKIVDLNNGYSQKEKNFEYFTNFIIKPLYMKTNNNSNGLKKSMLRSEKYKYFDGVTCFISTTQEGYLYHFSIEENDDSNPTCLTTYQFTAPVIHVALEYTCLHAFTEAGLESYTLRLPHHIAKTTSQLQNLKTTYPDISEPVCLIGLRSFIGVQQMINSNKYLVLLSKAENSWTVYSLRLPRPENVYYDIINAAKKHRTTSPSTYRHLLEEAHAMMRLAKDVADVQGNDTEQTQNESIIERLYYQSCALLGEYFIRSDNELERQLCIPYYKMSGLKPSEVLPSSTNAPGLVNYVTDVLMNIKSGPEADAFFQSRNIVDVISSESREDLLKIILGSVVLREYATDKLIKLLVSQNEDDSTRLALALLYLQAEKQTLARTSLDQVSDKFLLRTILGYPHLLFDEGAFDSDNQDNLTFSDLSATMICRKRYIFAQILTQIIDDDVLKFHQVMQVFVKYLPSRVNRDGLDVAAALQQFLETYLRSYFSKLQDKDEISHDFAVIEALKILVRSYLGILLQSKVYKSNEPLKAKEWKYEEAYLFESQRPKYLDKMPPCAKDYQKILNAEDLDEFSKANNEENDRSVKIEYLKLQALLASVDLPAECLNEVETFLDRESIDGTLALRTLCVKDTKIVTQMLIDNCPQAVLPYAKEIYTKETEWKLLTDLLQQKITNNNSSQEIRLFFEQTMIETLKCAAEVLPLKSLYCLFPENDDKAFQRYTETCDQIVHAEHVKSLLMKTGHQLLSTLNL